MKILERYKNLIIVKFKAYPAKIESAKFLNKGKCFRTIEYQDAITIKSQAGIFKSNVF